MASKPKKIVALGLSLALMMPTSLSCRVYAEQENDPDTGCSQALENSSQFRICTAITKKCSLDCYDALEGKVNTTPPFCGEHKIGENPSYFLGCNKGFQICMEVDCDDDVTAAVIEHVEWPENYPSVIAAVVTLTLIVAALVVPLVVSLAELIAIAPLKVVRAIFRAR